MSLLQAIARVRAALRFAFRRRSPPACRLEGLLEAKRRVASRL